MMVTTLRAFYDGQVLHPEGPVDLLPNRRYVVTVQAEGDAEPAYPLTEILGLATDMGVTDLSARHGHYAHGRLEDDGEQPS